MRLPVFFRTWLLIVAPWLLPMSPRLATIGGGGEQADRGALRATHARLKVGDREYLSTAVSAAVSLTLDLPAGESRLQTFLTHEPSGVSRGAFFFAVRRLD